MIKTSLQKIGVGAASILISSLGWAQAGYNLQEPQAEVARQMVDLHTVILVICLLVFVGVFGMMFYSVIRHRKSVAHQAAQFHQNAIVEIIWTVVPFFILIGMAWPATQSLLSPKDTSSPDLTVKVTGNQLKWSYEYLKGEGDLAGVADGVMFYSTLASPQEQNHSSAARGESYFLEVDKPLVIPVGKKVRVLITANDALHAWWVPAFDVKQDADPGLIRDAWFRVEKPGIYRRQCAELCGREHGFMPIVVVAIEQKEFAEWAAKQKTALAAGGATTLAPAGAAGQTARQALTADAHPESFARVVEEKQ